MDMSSRRNIGSVVTALLALGGLSLAACVAPAGGDGPGAAGVAADTVRPVGENLVGESCRLQPDVRAAAALPVMRGFKVYCGGWEQESGVVYETAVAPGTDGVVEEYARSGWWRDALASRMDCGAPRRVSILDGVPAAMLDCRLHGGGWHYIGLAVRIGDKVYLADGIPAVLPPLEAAVAGLADGFGDAVGSLGPRPRSAAIRDLETRLAGRLYGTGDLQDYRNLLEVAQYYNANKEFAKSEERYREALALHERLLGPTHPGRAYVLMHLALQLSNQERFDLADELFAGAEALLRPGDRREHALLLSYRALDAANRKQHETAHRLALLSTGERAELVAAAPPPPPPGTLLFPESVFQPRIEMPTSRRGALADEAVSRYITAATALELDRREEAESNLGKAFRILREIRQRSDWLYPNLLVLRAETQIARQDYAGAEASLRDAIAVHESSAGGARERDRAFAWMALGELQIRTGRIASGLESYERGFAIIGRGGRGVAFAVIRPFLEAAMAMARAEPDRADPLYRRMFAASQLVAGSLTEQLIERTAIRFAAADPKRREAIRAWEDARRRLEQATARLDAAEARPDAPQHLKQKFRAEFEAARELAGNREKEVLAAFPEYRQILDKPVSVADLQAALAPDEALVSVMLGEPQSYVFFVRPDSLAVHATDLSRAEAGRIVDLLRRPFEDELSLPHYDVVAAHELYARLLQPGEAQLEGVRHLVTVPNGPLLSLPFGVLVTEPHPPVDDYDYSRVAFLAKRTALSLSPSVAAFVKLRREARPSAASKAFIGFGDFVPIGDAQRLANRLALRDACREDVRLLAQLPRLAGSDQEVEAVARLFGSRNAELRLREAFSEATLRQTPLHDYRVVYFATHALLPRELNCFVEPSLLTSLPANAAAADNSLLESSEIRELKLDAELVVLSACNTGGAGLDTGGESLAGLARAFFAAGARSLLASHWIVDNQATVDLMRDSFATLADGSAANIAGALQASQRVMIAGVERSHPWYWGAFTLVGDGGRPATLLASAAR